MEAGVSMSLIEDMMQKMMRRFDLIDENVKELQNYLSFLCKRLMPM